ncbi:MAG: hypothetical protein WC511_01620 [Candidatus Pacearchaeota archaeon]
MEILEIAKKKLVETKAEIISKKNNLRDISLQLRILGNEIGSLTKKITYMHIAEKILTDVIERVSTENLRKIEALVNKALFVIFPDLGIQFKIEQSVKRGNNVYTFNLLRDGVSGSINSYGGGIIAAVSVVLFILFNVITKRFPLIVLDETLSFLAVKYIPAMSDFLRSLAKEFGIPVLMVTHQAPFATCSDVCSEIGFVNGNTNILGSMTNETGNPT